MFNQEINQVAITFENETLEAALGKLQTLKARQKDFIVPVQSMKMSDSGKVLIQNIAKAGVNSDGEHVIIKPNDVVHRQISTCFGIPSRYWKKMVSEHPELAAQNFNGWINKESFEKGEDKSRRMLVRSYMNEPNGNNGIFRALLSDRYLVYDNLNVLAVALKAVKEANDKHNLNITIDKCDLTEKKMFVRFICKDIEEQAPDALKNYRDPHNGENGGLVVSNGIVTGFVLSNSEVGKGSLMIAPRVVVLACKNGMVWSDEAYKRNHLGAKMAEGEKIWKKDTVQANITLVEKQLRDMIEKYVNPEYLSQRVKDIEAMADRKLTNPVECCKNICDQIGMTESEQNSVFDFFVKQGDTSSVFSIAQAMTSHAHTTNPDRRFEIEKEATTLLSIVDKCDIARSN